MFNYYSNKTNPKMKLPKLGRKAIIKHFVQIGTHYIRQKVGEIVENVLSALLLPCL